jgi:hypothetical protein
MLNFLATAKRWLREFIEIGFLLLLAIILIYLILGPNAGPFVTSVADNVGKFVTAVTAPGLIGIAIILALIYLITPRISGSGAPGGRRSTDREPRGAAMPGGRRSSDRQS